MPRPAMTSRERMLAALRRQPVDYVPCCPSFSASLLGPQYTWKSRADSLDRIVNELGLDARVGVSLEPSWHPDVSTQVWKERVAGEEWPVMHKRIDTPAGPLTAAIRVTPDLEHPDDIPLTSDWNVSRFVKPWLETEKDVERFRYVQLPPLEGDIARAREAYQARRRLADEFGIITYASCGDGLTHALQLFGPQQAVLLSMEQPELMERYLEIEHAATMRRTEILADWGVDVIRRNGFYETTDYWSPTQIRRWLVPRMKEQVAVMRSKGAATVYTVCTGIMPMLDILADLPFDAYDDIEPALGHQDMDKVSAALCPSHAVWGGVSGPMHIGEGTPEVARQAVRDAFRLFGPRGLVLGIVPSIRAHWPWENTLAAFDEWRRLRAQS